MFLHKQRDHSIRVLQQAYQYILIVILFTQLSRHLTDTLWKAYLLTFYLVCELKPSLWILRSGSLWCPDGRYSKVAFSGKFILSLLSAITALTRNSSMKSTGRYLALPFTSLIGAVSIILLVSNDLSQPQRSNEFRQLKVTLNASDNFQMGSCDDLAS